MAEPPDRTATLQRAEPPTADGGPHDDRRGLYPGALLCKYTLERVLGAGGMGIVWSARDPDLQRSVAIKLLQCDDASPDQRQRLLREARAMARLKHPNVITVYEVDSDGDRDYIAMELVEGASMEAWLTAKPPEDEVWSAVVAAGRGLAAAHAAGLVHRDFKPHNVLRSKDGRVLVTDFGLARGTGEHVAAIAPALSAEPVALARTLEARPRTDRVLDSTLTAPGALMGTPAYMAPEQFTGSDPDPRTDQFAFCITAWQALTGARPFTGESLAELRASASAGLAKVHAKLPRAVRAVLVRGLAAVPEQRWPDMDALLDALVRAHDRPRKLRALAIPAFALIAAVALLITLEHDTRQPALAPNPNGCAPPAKAFDAWTAERRAAFARRLDHQPTAIAIADAFDGFRTAWLARYAAACAAAPSPKTAARINCLLGERDDMDGLARLTDTVPSSAIAGMELWGLLPSLAVCEGDSPVAPPLLPEDRKQRDAIIRVRAELAALRSDPSALVEKRDSLVERAHKLGWKPLVPEIDAAAGAAAQILGDDDAARTRLTAAADDALRLADYRLEATARIGLVEVELAAMADPRDGKHVDRLIRDARDAVDRAGSDPALATSVETLGAAVELARGKLDEAVAVYDGARKKLIAAGALRSAGVAASQELHALRRRGLATDLDRAWQIGRDTEDAFAKTDRPVPHGDLDFEMSRIAWQRGDLKEVHARGDRTPQELPIADTVVEGHVVDAAGKPVAGARVAAWVATLQGDATRIYTSIDPRAIAVSAADGSFRVRGGGAVIAERGTERSLPATGASPTLRLAPTRTIHGHVKADTPLDAVAHFQVGAHGWDVVAPISTDGTFTLAGLVDAPAELSIRASDGANLREVSVGPLRDRLELGWPSGPALDVIVRGASPETPWITVKHTPRDTAIAAAESIGVRDATPAGMAQYLPGDRHAVIAPLTASTSITACVGPYRPDPAHPPACKTMKLGTESAAIVIAH
jgi:serine/threonine protein kinase